MTFACAAPMTLGREKRDNEHLTRNAVPRRQDVVDGLVPFDRPGHRGKAYGRIDGVVDRGGAVPGADEVDHDQIGALFAEPLVVEPPARGEVRHEEAAVVARCTHEIGEELTALVPTESRR